MSLNLDKSGWKRVLLGDVASASKERVDPAAGIIERYIAGEHMDTDDLKIRHWGSVGDGYLGPAFHRRFRPGQVLYGSRRTYLRKVAVAEFDGVTSNTTFVVETKDQTALSQELLPFVMSSERFHAFAIRESKGSVNPYVNWSDIERFEFELPSDLDEQKRLADLLWASEHHQAELRSAASAMSRTADSKFEAMLASEAWESRPVPTLLTAGPTNGKSALSNDEGRGVPTLSISAIRGGRVLGGESVKYMEVRPEDVASFMIEADDFLVVRGNGNKRLTGRGGLANGDLPEGCVYPDLLIRLRFDPAMILPRFAAMQWNSPSAHGALIRKAKSTNGIWKINGRDIKSHTLLVPPADIQRRALDELDGLWEAANAVVEEANKMTRFREVVSAEIFGGSE